MSEPGRHLRVYKLRQQPPHFRKQVMVNLLDVHCIEDNGDYTTIVIGPTWGHLELAEAFEDVLNDYYVLHGMGK